MRPFYQAHPPRSYAEEREQLITLILTALVVFLVALSGSGPVPA